MHQHGLAGMRRRPPLVLIVPVLLPVHARSLILSADAYRLIRGRRQPKQCLEERIALTLEQPGAG